MVFFNIIQIVLNMLYGKLLQIIRKNRTMIRNLYLIWLLMQVVILEIITYPKIFRNHLHFQPLLKYKDILKSYITSYKLRYHCCSFLDCINLLCLYIDTGGKGFRNKKRRICVPKVMPEIIQCYFFENHSPEKSDKEKTPVQSPEKNLAQVPQLSEEKCNIIDQNIGNSDVENTDVASTGKTEISLVGTMVTTQKRKASEKSNKTIKRQKSSEIQTTISVSEPNSSEMKVHETKHAYEEGEQCSNPNMVEQNSVESRSQVKDSVQKPHSVYRYMTDSKDDPIQNNSKIVETESESKNTLNNSVDFSAFPDIFNTKSQNNFSDNEKSDIKHACGTSVQNDIFQSKDASPKMFTDSTFPLMNLASSAPEFKAPFSISRQLPDTSASILLKRLASAYKQGRSSTDEGIDSINSIPDIKLPLDTRKSILVENTVPSFDQKNAKETGDIKAKDFSDTQMSSLKSDNTLQSCISDLHEMLPISEKDIIVNVDVVEISDTEENNDDKENISVKCPEESQLADEDRCSSYGDDMSCYEELFFDDNVSGGKSSPAGLFDNLSEGTIGGLNEEETNIVLRNVIEKLQEFSRGAPKVDASDMDKNSYREFWFNKLTDIKRTLPASVPTEEFKMPDIYSKIINDFDCPNKSQEDKSSFTENIGPPSYKAERSETGMPYRVMQEPKSKIRDSGDSSETLVNTNTHRLQDGVSSPSPVQSMEIWDNERNSNSFGMYEIGESSHETLEWDRNYTPYPGLALDPYNVKKDSRYQKKFYRQKREGTLPMNRAINQQGSIIPLTISAIESHVKRDEIKSEAMSNEDTKANFGMIIQTGEEASQINLGEQCLPEEFDAAHEFRTADIPPLELCVPEDFPIEPAKTGYSKSSFMEESPSSNSPERIGITESRETSPIRSDDLESKMEEDLKSCRVSIEETYFVEISFVCGDLIPGKASIYLRDRFYDPVVTGGYAEACIPLMPIFQVEDVIYKYTEHELSVEEFLSNLRNLESVYYEMKYFKDPTMTEFRSLIRYCRIPLKLQYEFDNDYELVGNTLQLQSSNIVWNYKPKAKGASLQTEVNEADSTGSVIENNSRTTDDIAAALILQSLLNLASAAPHVSAMRNLHEASEFPQLQDYQNVPEISRTDYVHKKFKYNRTSTEDKCIQTMNESALFPQIKIEKNPVKKALGGINQMKGQIPKCEVKTGGISVQSISKILKSIEENSLECKETLEPEKFKLIQSLSLCNVPNTSTQQSTLAVNQTILDTNESYNNEREIVCGKIFKEILSENMTSTGENESHKMGQDCEKPEFETFSTEHQIKMDLGSSNSKITESVAHEDGVNQMELTEENKNFESQSSLPHTVDESAKDAKESSRDEAEGSM